MPVGTQRGPWVLEVALSSYGCPRPGLRKVAHHKLTGHVLIRAQIPWVSYANRHPEFKTLYWQGL